MGIRFVVPPLTFKESEMLFPMAAAAVVVEDDVSPLGVTTREGASFPLGSAQLMPRKSFVFVARLLGEVAEVEEGLVSFFEQAAKKVSTRIA